MSYIEQEIKKFEARPSSVKEGERQKHVAMLAAFSEINKFEGIAPSSLDERLFQLLTSGKISKKEYLALCIRDACGKA